MTQIVLGDLDPVIIERLKARAQKHGRSLQLVFAITLFNYELRIIWS